MAGRPGSQLHLVCPGLLPVPRPVASRLPRTPALDRLLSRADRVESGLADPQGTLAAAFGLVAAPGEDLPTAALSLLAEAPELAAAGVWFHADPVHLRPDRDRLLLFGGPALGVDRGEAEALVSAFNAHFAPDGLALVAPSPGRWYLRVPSAPRLRTRSLAAVHGRSVDPFVPAGAEAPSWMRWQNEAQMLFFQHPVNEARAAAGLPTLSGLWTWGGGALPRVDMGPDLTIADEPLARGLARAAGRPVLALAGPLPDSWPSSVLILWDRLWWPSLDGDWDAWLDGLAELEALVARCLADLKTGRLAGLRLDDGAGHVSAASRWGLRRAWRRLGRLRDWVAATVPPGAPRT